MCVSMDDLNTLIIIMDFQQLSIEDLACFIEFMNNYNYHVYENTCLIM